MMELRTPEEIGAKMDALGIWDVLCRCNFAVKPKGVAFPYFCIALKGETDMVRIRFLLLEGWQTMHDFVRIRTNRFAGFHSSPIELPHFELVYPSSGGCLVFRHDTGYMPRPATEDQRKLVSRILWEAYGVMMRIESDRSLPMKFSSEKAVFSRIEVQDGVWSDSPLEIPDPRPCVERVVLSANDVKKAKDLPFVQGDVIELDFRLLPDVMTKDARPRCVYGLLAIDPASGDRVIDCRTSVRPDAGLKEMWESVAGQVLKELIRRGKVPGEIRFCSERVFRMLRPLCIELPIRISLHERLPALESAYANHFREDAGK